MSLSKANVREGQAYIWNIENSFNRYQKNNKREITPEEAASPPGTCEFRDRFLIDADATNYTNYYQFVKDKEVQKAPGWNFSHSLNALILFRNALPEDYENYRSLILTDEDRIPPSGVDWVVL